MDPRITYLDSWVTQAIRGSIIPTASYISQVLNTTPSPSSSPLYRVEPITISTESNPHPRSFHHEAIPFHPLPPSHLRACRALSLINLRQTNAPSRALHTHLRLRSNRNLSQRLGKPALLSLGTYGDSTNEHSTPSSKVIAGHAARRPFYLCHYLRQSRSAARGCVVRWRVGVPGDG